MNKLTKIILWVLLFSVIGFQLSITLAETESWGLYGSEPIEVLDRVANEANKDYQIQETALNTANDAEGGYQSDYKITNTLDYLRNNIAPYLQRAVYIGLAAAVILIIYNGLLMVTNSLHKEWDMAKVKKRLINIVIGVLLLTGFYAIIKIAVGLINSVFGTAGWGSGF